MDYIKEPMRKALIHPLKRFYDSDLFMALLVAAITVIIYLAMLKEM